MGWLEKAYGFTPIGMLDNATGGHIRGAVKEGLGSLQRDDQGFGDALSRQSGAAGRFASQGERGFTKLGGEATAEREYLRRIARGEDSVSAEQLRQGLQQNMAAQQAMAAGARPGNSAMAARNASMNAARMGTGLAGQQALAGIQERQVAQNALANMLMQQRQQELQAATQSRGQAIGGYGAGMGAALGQPSTGEQALGAGMGIAQLLMLASDRNLKTEIRDGGDDADAFLAGLKSYSYDYKDPKFGKERQLGVMAQDLEKTHLGKQAVINTAHGKMVNPAKLSGALAAAAARLDQRVRRLEGKS